MSTKRHNVCIATHYTKSDGEKRTRYTTVGSAFFNTTQSGMEVINVVLDFPVGVTDLAIFPPKEKDEG